MTTRLTITIRKDSDRDEAHALVRAATVGSRVEFKQPRRSLEQNDLMWARLHDISQQVTWHGQKLTDTDWKDVFTAGLRRARIVPNIDGDGFVQLGLHTSDLTKDEMSNLLDLMDAFAANHGVTFNEPIPDSSGGDSSKALAHAETDAPAANGPHAVVAAGVREEASLLSDDWRDVMVQNLAGHRDRPASLAHRRNDGLQMIGGAPNALEEAWIDRLSELVARRNRGQLKPGEYETELAQLKAMPLTAAKVAA